MKRQLLIQNNTNVPIHVDGRFVLPGATKWMDADNIRPNLLPHVTGNNDNQIAAASVNANSSCEALASVGVNADGELIAISEYAEALLINDDGELVVEFDN